MKGIYKNTHQRYTAKNREKKVQRYKVFNKYKRMMKAEGLEPRWQRQPEENEATGVVEADAPEREEHSRPQKKKRLGAAALRIRTRLTGLNSYQHTCVQVLCKQLGSLMSKSSRLLRKSARRPDVRLKSGIESVRRR